MDIDMEALAKTVADKANINIDQARKAVTAVVEQLKAKVPEFDTLLKKTPLAGIKI